jgi:hypothetical protein
MKHVTTLKPKSKPAKLAVAPTATNTIRNHDDFFRYLAKCVESERNTLYRGVKKTSYKLIPTVGRLNNKRGKPFTKAQEQLMLKLFKQKGYPHLAGNVGDDIALLTIAQHHGMPTRLLDWTRNPLVAFYFAVRDEFALVEPVEDSAIYIYHPGSKVDLAKSFDPFAITKVERYIPKYWNPRIIAQVGEFTVHPDPAKAFEPPGLEVVHVQNAARKVIKLALQNLGVNSATLFPDLDGISTHIKWLRSDAF